MSGANEHLAIYKLQMKFKNKRLQSLIHQANNEKNQYTFAAVCSNTGR